MSSPVHHSIHIYCNPNYTTLQGVAIFEEWKDPLRLEKRLPLDKEIGFCGWDLYVILLNSLTTSAYSDDLKFPLLWKSSVEGLNTSASSAYTLPIWTSPTLENSKGPNSPTWFWKPPTSVTRNPGVFNLELFRDFHNPKELFPEGLSQSCQKLRPQCRVEDLE